MGALQGRVRDTLSHLGGDDLEQITFEKQHGGSAASWQFAVGLFTRQNNTIRKNYSLEINIDVEVDIGASQHW